MPVERAEATSMPRQLGKHSRLSASLGVPPIAYMSLRAFAAATCPKVYGSSTIGGKKSTVFTMASSSDTL